MKDLERYTDDQLREECEFAIHCVSKDSNFAIACGSLLNDNECWKRKKE